MTDLLLEAEECIAGGLPIAQWRKLAKEVEAFVLKTGRPLGQPGDMLIHAQLVLAWGSPGVKSLPYGGADRWLARWLGSELRAEIERKMLEGA